MTVPDTRNYLHPVNGHSDTGDMVNLPRFLEWHLLAAENRDEHEEELQAPTLGGSHAKQKRLPIR